MLIWSLVITKSSNGLLNAMNVQGRKIFTLPKMSLRRLTPFVELKIASGAFMVQGVIHLVPLW